MAKAIAKLKLIGAAGVGWGGLLDALDSLANSRHKGTLYTVELKENRAKVAREPAP